MKADLISLRLVRVFTLLLMCVVLTIVTVVPVGAQTYEELPPELEERAQRIYSGVMCPQCAGQTIDESNAPIAEAMREAIKAQLRGGATDDAIVDSLVQSYGKGILASPPTRGFSLLAWLVPPFVLLLGAAAVALAIRNMRGRSMTESAAAAAGGGTTDIASAGPLPFDLVDRELGVDTHAAEER